MSSRCFVAFALLACLGMTAPAQPPGAVRLLELGKPLREALAGGQSRTYRVPIESGQYMHVVVDQRGIDVVLVLSGPDNKKLASIDRWSALYGEESISVVAEARGDYRVEVRSESKAALAGQFEIKLTDIRTPTAVDLKRIAGERTYTAGDDLNGEGTAESRRHAIQKLEESLSLWRTVGDPLWEGTTLLYLGLIHYDFGEMHEATECYTQALPFWRTARNRSGEGATLSSIGRAYDSLGDYQKALDYYNDALPLLRAAGERDWESHAVHDMGMTYLSLGEPEQALRYYTEALRLEEGINSTEGRAHMLHHIGEAYIQMGALQKALQPLDQALELSKSAGDHLGEATALNHLGRTYDLSGDREKSLQYYKQALTLRQSAGYRLGEAQTLQNIGILYQGQGNSQLALNAYSEALAIDRTVGDRRGEASTLNRIAGVHANAGDLAAARAEAESCIQIAESLRAKVTTPELRAAYFSTAHDYYDTYIDVLMRLQRLRPSEEHQAEALAVSERAKARVLLEMLREARAEIRRGVDPGLLDREQSLRSKIDAKAEYHMHLISARHTEQEAAALQKEIDDLFTQSQQVEAAIRETSPSYSALTQPTPLSAREIQTDIVDADTLLLEYSLGEERSYLWAVSPTSISTFELPKRAEIESSVRRFYDLVTARNFRPFGESAAEKNERLRRAEEEYPDAAAALARMLLGQATSLLGEKRLLIVGDGALNYVPFGALPIGAEGEPLTVKHEVINLPSASILGVLRHELTGRTPAPKLVAVLADPVFQREDARVGARGRVPTDSDPKVAVSRLAGDVRLTDGLMPLARLPFTRQEGDAIMSRARAEHSDDSMEAVDFDAGREKVIAGELAPYRIVHFATHGFLDTTHPELSGLVLSLVDREGKARDGFLKLEDVYNLNLPAELVVLSACQTGLGKDIKGEGLIGLTRGFMYAGAKRVVASLWSVNDVATAELMGHFYEAILTDKMPPASALRAAQVTMWRQKRWSSPYYWAAFTIQGDWQ